MLLRGWWCMELFLLCFLLLQPFGRRPATATAAADCWYAGKRHRELSSVPTTEPCLNCTCKKGTLLCYLRVCPELPDPPPPGCIIVHKYRSCCSKLICSDSPLTGNDLQSRSEPDDLPSFFEEPALRQACEYEGSIFEPGSAMTSSTFCEHCFCIGGQQRCIRPKCLLQIQGCQPVYEDYSCCPVRYDCTIKHQALPPPRRNHIEVTTVKLNKKKNGGGIREGCFVSKKYYPEGSKVLGLGYSVCDNCYCVRSMVHCEPMSCAPPLLGCAPVIKDGECCATSYNCNNSIEIQPNPNYGEFPEISKEYAKLRKEVPMWSNQEITQKISIDNGLHYVIAQSLNNLHSERPGTLQQNSIHPVKEIHHNAYKRHTSPSAASSKYPNVSSNLKQFIEIESVHYKPKPIKSTPKYTLDGRVIRKVDNKSLDEETTIATTKTVTSNSTSTTTTRVTPTLEITSTNTQDPNTTTEVMTITHTSTLALSVFETDSTLSDNFITDSSNETIPTVITTVVSNSTCLETSTNVDETTIELSTKNLNAETKQDIENKSNSVMPISQDENKINVTIGSGYTTSSNFPTTELDSKLNVSTPTFILLPAISPLIGGILNESMAEDSEDYDYSEPTLPPSLPNLRIIPFVAADAVDETNEEENTRFSPVTQSPPYTLFSPPTKTEGGFVPKEPPLPIEGYENNFHVPTTHVVSEKASSIKPLTEIPNMLNYSCQVESTLFEHGQTVPGKDTCTICTCLYGKVACHEPECPPPEIYCQEPSVTEILSCCPTHYCGDDPLDGPVDRVDSFVETLGNYSASKSSNGGKPSDREEMPFLNLNFSHSSLPQPSKPTSEYKSSLPTGHVQTFNNNNNKNNNNNNENPDRKHLNNNEINETTKDTNQNTSNSQSELTKIYGNSNNKSMLMMSTTTMTLTSRGQNDEVAVSIAGGEDKGNNNIDGTVGVLKLAGCNIYGRMYRVGKIIFELSGPCLECRCTDIGVQCKSNKC